MALTKQAADLLKKKTDDKGHKGKDFMAGLKSWITSPGGIVTLILFLGLVIYVHKELNPSPAKK